MIWLMRDRSGRRDIFWMALWHALRGAGYFGPWSGGIASSTPGYCLATLRVGGAGRTEGVAAVGQV